MPRARDLGIEIGRLPPARSTRSPTSPGVRVGHTTLIEGEGRRGRPGRCARCQVVPPRPREPVFAGSHTLNGNGELTGLEWIRESGLLTTPIGLTNTHSVGVVRDALIAAAVATARPDEWRLEPARRRRDVGRLPERHQRLPRPAPSTSFAALETARDGPVEEGCVGGGTGMICHGFKGGIGTSSRVDEDGWTVGALVQANYGRRSRLRVNGVPVGQRIGAEAVPLPAAAPARGPARSSS